MTHFTGLILTKIARLVNVARDPSLVDVITIDQHQQNGSYGVHQARVRLNDDPVIYRMILAPVDAPISINGVAADNHFAKPIHLVQKFG